jgi:hypothetical protein
MPSTKFMLVSLVFALQCFDLVPALPLNGREIQARRGKKQSAATGNGAASAPKVSTATDGSTIIDQTVAIKCVVCPIRFFRSPLT